MGDVSKEIILHLVFGKPIPYKGTRNKSARTKTSALV